MFVTTQFPPKIFVLTFSYHINSPWNTFLPEKHTAPQLVNKFPAFYGTRSSLPHSQEAATCPYPKIDHFSPSLRNSASWKSILILFFHLRLGFPGFPTKTLYATLLSPICAMYILHTESDVSVHDYTKTCHVPKHGHKYYWNDCT